MAGISGSAHFNSGNDALLSKRYRRSPKANFRVHYARGAVPALALAALRLRRPYPPGELLVRGMVVASVQHMRPRAVLCDVLTTVRLPGRGVLDRVRGQA